MPRTAALRLLTLLTFGWLVLASGGLWAVAAEPDAAPDAGKSEQSALATDPTAEKNAEAKADEKAADEQKPDADDATRNDSGDKAKLVSGSEPIKSPTGSKAVEKAGGKTTGDTNAPSAAERIARLERTLDSDAARLQELDAALSAPNSEFVKAKENFREWDDQRTALLAKLEDLEKAGEQDELNRLKAELVVLQKKWTLAKERFELATVERKAIGESISTLQKKLASDRASLDKLQGPHDPRPLETPPTAAAPVAPPGGSAPAPATGTAPESPAPDAPTNAPAATATNPPPNPAPSAPLPIANPLALPATQTPPTAEGAKAPENAKPFLAKEVAKQLEAASEVAERSQEAARAAEDKARSIAERIEILQQDIVLQRELRGTARKNVDNSEQTLQSLSEEMFRSMMEGKDVSKTQEQIREATQRLHDSNHKARRISTKLDELQSQLAQLQSEQLSAKEEATEKRKTADQDQETVEQLKNPFTLHNMMQSTINHGPRIVTIILALGAFVWLTRILETRLVALTALRGRRGGREERENRARTLLGIFRNVVNIAVIAGGVMMVLDEIGIPVAPLIGGAAVFGLAIAFGAQSLIKDYFVGFMVLLEQQYLVNDVIAIGEIRGQVESISLRITVLRDLEGRVHFVPHSQIATVTNLTHGWSRAVFEIGVAYKESVDRVIEVLNTLAHELRNDEAYRLLILSDPVMLGVDAFDNSAVVIKFYIQTRPLQQWTVKREMLRRIKNEFDRLGIEIPFPHLTLYRGIAQSQAAGSDTSIERLPKRDVA